MKMLLSVTALFVILVMENETLSLAVLCCLCFQGIVKLLKAAAKGGAFD